MSEALYKTELISIWDFVESLCKIVILSLLIRLISWRRINFCPSNKANVFGHYLRLFRKYRHIVQKIKQTFIFNALWLKIQNYDWCPLHTNTKWDADRKSVTRWGEKERKCHETDASSLNVFELFSYYVNLTRNRYTSSIK